MSARDPVAFWSYVQEDDKHEGGRITSLRERLEGEIRAQTGSPFPIFQDRNDLQWGDHWKSRIESTVKNVTFLVPIITPSYFRSQACRNEFEVFLKRESTLGLTNLIFPIYYITASQLRVEKIDDVLVDTIRSRQWADWRELRFEALEAAIVRKEIARLATSIAAAQDELGSVLDKDDSFAAAKSRPPRRATKLTKFAPKPSTSSKSTQETFEAHDAPKLSTSKVPVVRTASFSEKTLSEIREGHEYYIYTNIFDETIESPQEFFSAKEVLDQFGTLSKNISEFKATQFSSLKRDIYRINKFENRPALSILVDNSGSMRGRPIHTVSAWVAITSEILQNTGIQHEVIGFTTRAWKGGRSRELWIQDGRPKAPGRICDLRYLLYKSFRLSHQASLPNFGAMLGEGILKENIDGEAILYAYDRIIDREENRKIIFVISDGAPVDDYTMEANTPEFLNKHLESSIDFVRGSTKVDIHGIGIGHSVAKYYGEKQSHLISDLESGSQIARYILRTVVA